MSQQQLQKLLTERLNETGFPFQEWCFDVIAKISGPTRVTKEYPLTFPVSTKSSLGNFSSIDLIALKVAGNRSVAPEILSVFFIECKKSKPGIKKWCFVKTQKEGSNAMPYFIVHRLKDPVEPGSLEFEQEIYYLNQFFGLFEGQNFKPEAMEPVLYAYEINHLADALNRSQEEKIYKSVLQSVRGCAWLESSEPFLINEIGLTAGLIRKVGCNIIPRRHCRLVIIPMIITTSELYVANFNPSDVHRGEIKMNSIKWEKRDWLIYDFGLPDYLQKFNRANRPVFIVSADYFADFYARFLPIVYTTKQ